MTFRTKIDWWAWPVIGLLAIAPVLLVMRLVFGHLRPGEALAIGLSLAVLVFVRLIAWPVTYTLGPDALVVRFGFVRKRIPYAAISAVTPSRNPLSAPAWSLDRLRVEHDGGWILISPENTRAFVAALAERARRLAP